MTPLAHSAIYFYRDVLLVLGSFFIAWLYFDRPEVGRQKFYSPEDKSLDKASVPIDCKPSSAPSFWSLGLHVGTDKVEGKPEASHTYQWAYEKYLRPRRCEELKLMEIGLGCNMPYSKSKGAAEGRSIKLWLAFLPKASIGVFEYDKYCAHNWFQNDPHEIGRDVLDARVVVTTGDQLKTDDLLQAITTLGPQDVIIDDGGHTNMMQQTSLRVLFPYVRPGGIYILEDLQVSFWGAGDNPHGITMVDYILNIISGLHFPKHAEKLDKSAYPGLLELLPLIKSVDCFREICVFQRWKEGEPGSPPNPEALTFDQA